jgi:hypothetical protein
VLDSGVESLISFSWVSQTLKVVSVPSSYTAHDFKSLQVMVHGSLVPNKEIEGQLIGLDDYVSKLSSIANQASFLIKLRVEDCSSQTITYETA